MSRTELLLRLCAKGYVLYLSCFSAIDSSRGNTDINNNSCHIFTYAIIFDTVGISACVVVYDACKVLYPICIKSQISGFFQSREFVISFWDDFLRFFSKTFKMFVSH